MTVRYFDDFAVGDRFVTASKTVTESEILHFAFEFDPQPFHIDAAAAADTPFGGLIASGFHTLSLSMSLFFRLRLLERPNLGSPGIDEIRWLQPLRPGDTIHQVAEVIDLKRSKSKPDRGVIWMRHDTLNQQNEIIMQLRCMHMLRRRIGAPDQA